MKSLYYFTCNVSHCIEEKKRETIKKYLEINELDKDII
jgi:hypothetical protein